MKIRFCALIAGVCFLMLGCDNIGKSKDELLGDFAKSVLKSGKEKDSGTFVNKLSMSSVADLNAIIAVLTKANPQARSEENAEKPTDEAIRKETEANVHLFMDSYADLFDGKLSSVVTVQDRTVKGTNICSIIIWAKYKDGKYRGIKIESVWIKDDGTIKVITWVQLSGYEASKNAIKKKAILVRDTAEACDYPEWTEYECVFTD
jgi:hypothetical protein